MTPTRARRRANRPRTDQPAASRRSGLGAAMLAAVGVAIAGYLVAVKIAGELPACGPLRGCETVATSPYSEVFGIPVAVFGILYSAAVAVLQLTWWRSGDRRALIAAYALGLAAVVLVGYLTAVELFVIHAVCVWCAAYAVVVIAGWIIATISIRRA